MEAKKDLERFKLALSEIRSIFRETEETTISSQFETSFMSANSISMSTIDQNTDKLKRHEESLTLDELHQK